MGKGANNETYGRECTCRDGDNLQRGEDEFNSFLECHLNLINRHAHIWSIQFGIGYLW